MGWPVCCITLPLSSSFEQRKFDKQHPIQQMTLITEITVPQTENEMKNFDILFQNHIQVLSNVMYLPPNPLRMTNP